MLGRGGRSVRTLAMAALLAGLSALASALACSLLVDPYPSIVYCDPDGGSVVCGTGQVCAPPATGTQYLCVAQCPNTPCRSGETCDPVNHWCVPIDDTGPPPEASDGDASDAAVPEVVAVDVLPMTDADAGATDVDAQCTGFGCACSPSANCPPPFACVEQMAVTSDIWNAWAAGGRGGTGFCAEPCCTSGECPLEDGGNDLVCFATGRGGNYCVPKDWLHDRSTLGSSRGGATCTGTECRSGLCLDSGVCADTCCSANSGTQQCTGNSSCLVSAFPGSGFDTHLVANCGEALLGRGLGSNCAMNSDCRTGLCVSSGAFGQICEEPCRNDSNDCPPNGVFTRTCDYVPSDLNGPSTDIVASCVPTTFGEDAGAAVCFHDDPTSSMADCPGARCRPQPQTVGAMNTTYSVLACGM